MPLARNDDRWRRFTIEYVASFWNHTRNGEPVLNRSEFVVSLRDEAMDSILSAPFGESTLYPLAYGGPLAVRYLIVEGAENDGRVRLLKASGVSEEEFQRIVEHIDSEISCDPASLEWWLDTLCCIAEGYSIPPEKVGQWYDRAPRVASKKHIISYAKEIFTGDEILDPSKLLAFSHHVLEENPASDCFQALFGELGSTFKPLAGLADWPKPSAGEFETARQLKGSASLCSAIMDGILQSSLNEEAAEGDKPVSNADFLRRWLVNNQDMLDFYEVPVAQTMIARMNDPELPHQERAKGAICAVALSFSEAKNSSAWEHVQETIFSGGLLQETAQREFLSVVALSCKQVSKLLPTERERDLRKTLQKLRIFGVNEAIREEASRLEKRLAKRCNWE